MAKEEPLLILKAVKMNLKQIKAYGYLKRMGVKTLPQRIDFLYQHQAKLISQQQSLKNDYWKNEWKNW